MRGISEKQLEEARNNVKLNWDARRAIDIVLHLIPLSELQEPWMTLDEFLKSGFEGKCWITLTNKSVFECKYQEWNFIARNSCVSYESITHVRPIHKPEPPK